MTHEPMAIPVSLARRRRPVFERLGPDAAGDEELLALVLGDRVAAPRVARRLLERFGSLPGVMQAAPLELQVAGLSRAAALRVSACVEPGGGPPAPGRPIRG